MTPEEIAARLGLRTPEETAAWFRLYERMTGAAPEEIPMHYEHVVASNLDEYFVPTPERGDGLGLYSNGRMIGCFSWEQIQEEIIKGSAAP